MTAPTLRPPPDLPVHPEVTPAPPSEPTRAGGVGVRFGQGSALYALCGVFNRAIGFLLLPIYTHLLTPDQYGAVTIVLIIATFLGVLFAMALTAAAMRFYHEYRDQPDELRAFLGTLLTAVFAVSGIASALLLVGGESLLQPILKDVSFWPLMAMGLGVAAFHPFIETCLMILQTAEKRLLYGAVAMSSVLVKAVLAIVLVAGCGLGAEGVLGAHAATAVVFFATCLWCLRRTVRIGIRPAHLRKALGYSLPLLPHTLASSGKQILDRMFLVHLVSTAAAGIYALGFQFGTLTQIVFISFSKALNPIFMRALQDRDHERLANIRNLGLTMVLAYCWVSATISLFAPEVIVLLTGPEFHDSYRVVPFVTFAFAATGIYSLLVQVLLFDRRTSRYVSIGTILSLGLGAALSYALIPRYGIEGAAAALLVTQVVYATATAVAVRRCSDLRWQHGRFATMFAISFAIALWPLAPQHEVSWPGFAIKAAMACSLLALLSIVGYGTPMFLWHEVAALRARLRNARRESSDD